MKEYFFNTTGMFRETVEGNVDRYIFSGDKIQVVEYRFPPNKSFPAHSHEEQDQMGYLVSGKMGFRVGETETVMEAGDFYYAPRGVEHCSWTLDEPAVLLDFFAPPREDLRR